MRTILVLAASLPALAVLPQSAHAQRESLAVAPRVVERWQTGCFGVSFDRDCDVMVQYEVGYRFLAAGSVPHRAGADAVVSASSRHGAFVAGGLMYARSGGRALGVVYDVGRYASQWNYALGVRQARALANGARVDLTAGAVAKRVAKEVVAGRQHYGYSPGAFAEATLHGTDYFAVTVRDELHMRAAGFSSANALLIGARLERGPAVAATVVAAALFLIAGHYYGPG